MQMTVLACLQTNSQGCGRIFMKFSGNVNNGIVNRYLTAVVIWIQYQDPGIF